MDLKTAERIARGENLIAEAERLLAKHRADKKAARARRRSRSLRASGTDKDQKRLTKKEQRSTVRAAVVARAGGLCEAPVPLHAGANPAYDLRCCAPGHSMDHFHGRAREESVESCWFLCVNHDLDKTRNQPSRADWLRRFRKHAESHGYAGQVAKVDRLLALEFAQHPEHRPSPSTPETKDDHR